MAHLLYLYFVGIIFAGNVIGTIETGTTKEDGNADLGQLQDEDNQDDALWGGPAGQPIQKWKCDQNQKGYKFDDTKMQEEIATFLKSAFQSDTVKECKGSPFTCIEFPKNILTYLGCYNQFKVNRLGIFSTKHASHKTLSNYKGKTKHLNANTMKISAYVMKFDDPLWRLQWYMQDYRTYNIPVMDHNVVPVFDMGITGKGVTVAVMSNGVRRHPDLGKNYDKSISYDFCLDKTGSDPNSYWSFTRWKYNNRGTTGAGLIAMKAGNALCGVGIAHNARIAGYKLEECPSSKVDYKSLLERALRYQFDVIDIYCNMWTSEDTKGKYLEELASDVVDAYKNGLQKGRKGKGSIYVISSGENRENNNCASNGHVNNPYVITIASAAQDGTPAYYSERCAAVFATAYSGDSKKNTERLVTISANGYCKMTFEDRPTGSAIGSGIIALLLETKPSLTYRDVMHIIAMTAEVAPLADNEDTWYRNGRGFWVSNDFGFGLLNAENMINAAKTWTLVPKKNLCLLNKKFYDPLRFDHVSEQVVTLDAGICKGAGSGISHLEHIELEVTIDHSCRGAISLNITSPAKTESTLLQPRTEDCSKDGFKGWKIMSVHNWGENPKGVWSIKIKNINVIEERSGQGYIKELILKLHGTQEIPAEYPRKYAAFRLPNGKTNEY